MTRPAVARRRLAVVGLLGVTAAWGASFVLMKPAIERQPIPDFLATRFVIATLLLVLARPTVLKDIDRRTLWTGGIAGCCLGAGYVTQTIGLHYASPAVTGFLTGLYVVATPFLALALFRQPLSAKVVVAAVLALVGLATISLTEFGVGVGESWIILGALMFALHIVVLGRWSSGADVYALTVVQLAVASVGIGLLAFADGDGFVLPPDGDVWFAVLVTAVLATAVGFVIQTWAQAHMDPSRVAIILTAEVPWTAIMSVSVGMDVLTPRMVIGGAIMFAAMILAEWPTRKAKPGEIVPTHPLGHFE